MNAKPLLTAVLLLAAACGSGERLASREASACPVEPSGMRVAADTVDFWHVYLDGARVAQRPGERLTLAEVRRARGLCIAYFTDAGAETGARMTALAVGPGGRREIGSRVMERDGRAEFPVRELARRLGPADSLVFRIQFPAGGLIADRPWSEPYDFLAIGR